MNKNVLLYAAILIFGLAAPFVFPAFKVQLSILCVLIVLATTWNIQGEKKCLTFRWVLVPMGGKKIREYSGGKWDIIHLEIFYSMV